MSSTDVLTILGPVSAILGTAIAALWKRQDKLRLEARQDLADKVADLKSKISECDEERHHLSVRVMALEATGTLDLPRWIRTQDGVLMSVTPSFVQLFGAPNGYRGSDMVGKKLADLSHFSPELLRILAEMDAEALKRGYSSRSKVPISKGLTAAVIKGVRTGSTGDVVFIGCAVPD